MTDIVSSVPSPSPKAVAKTASSARPGSAATVPFTTDWHQFVNTDIIAALSGTATAITAMVERSAVNPAGKGLTGAAQGAVTSPADSTGFTGDLSAGIAPNIYTESGVGWWRINVTAIAGGNCIASLSGLGIANQ